MDWFAIITYNMLPEVPELLVCFHHPSFPVLGVLSGFSFHSEIVRLLFDFTCSLPDCRYQSAGLPYL